MRHIATLACATVPVFGTAITATAQQPQLTDVTITADIDECARLRPTEARVASLQRVTIA